MSPLRAAAALAVMIGAAGSAASIATAATSHMSLPAVTFVVNTTIDSHDLTNGDGHCANSSGKCSLRAAVEEAAVENHPVNIVLPAGTYPTTLGAINVTTALGLVITGAGASKTTITASGTSDRVFLLSGGHANLTVIGVTMTGGNALTAPQTGDGGAIDVSNSGDSLTLLNDVVSNSNARLGGGIYSLGGLFVTGTSVVSNTASAPYAQGAGISLGGGVAEIRNSTFSHNSASGTGPQGGAIYSDANTNITNSTFLDNSVQGTSGDVRGGAIYSEWQLGVAHSTFTGNSVSPAASPGNMNAYGGALAACYGASFVTGSTFSHNSVTSAGTGSAKGGAVSLPCDVVTFTGDSFTSNSATSPGTGSAFGGAIMIDDGSGYGSGAGILGTALTFTGNTAASTSGDTAGGAIYNGSSGVLTLSSSTLNANHANVRAGYTGTQSGGGAIFDSSCGSGSVISGTSFAGNVAANSQGGAFYNNSCGDSFTNDRFVGNHATGTVGASDASSAEGTGGALSLYDTSQVINSYIANNTADLFGGGIYSDDSQRIVGVTVTGNKAPTGAGFYTDANGDYVINSAIVDNVGTGPSSQAAGVFVSDNLNIASSTIVGNRAASAPGIEVTSSKGNVTLRNSLVAGNFLGSGSLESDCSGAFSSNGGNRIGDGSCNLPGRGDHQSADAGYIAVSSSGHATLLNDGTLASLASHITATTGQVVGAARAADGLGYWVATAKGYVFGVGSATSMGAATGKAIVAIAATPDGNGYWLLGANGTVYPFGAAPRLGNAAGPSVAMTAAPDGNGYWIVSASGTVSHFGTAVALGSLPGQHVASIAAAPDGNGYWLATTTGVVKGFGTAKSLGSKPGQLVATIVPTRSGTGYWLFTKSGAVFKFGVAATLKTPAAMHGAGPFAAVLGL
jgi:predicted outer membrane repeat protein